MPDALFHTPPSPTPPTGPRQAHTHPVHPVYPVHPVHPMQSPVAVKGARMAGHVETLCAEVARGIAEKKEQAESMQMRLVMGTCDIDDDDRERVVRRELDLTLRRSMMDPVALVQLEFRSREQTMAKDHELKYRWPTSSGKRSDVPVVVEWTSSTHTETVRGMTVLMNRVARLMHDEGCLHEAINPHTGGCGWDMRARLAMPGDAPPGPDDFDVCLDMDDVRDEDDEDEFEQKVVDFPLDDLSSFSMERARAMFTRDGCKLGWLLHTLAFNGARTLEDEQLSEHAAKTLRAGGF